MKARGWVLALPLLAPACERGPADPSVPPTTTPPAVLAPEPDLGPPRWRDLDVEGSLGGAGYAAGCAVEQGGALWCWGEDAALQVGLRDDPSAGRQGRTRKYAEISQVRGVEDAIAVAVSVDATCTIATDGALRCIDLSAPDWWMPTPNEEVLVVDLAEDRGCALTEAGEVKCWTEREPARRRVGGALDLSVSKERGCATTSTGEIQCWIWNDVDPPTVLEAPATVRDIQLSDGRGLVALDQAGRIFVHALDPTKPEQGWVASGHVEDGVELGVARNHLCVRTAGAQLHCRGHNSHGQLGDGSSTRRERFVHAGFDEALALAVTDNRSCALTRDAIACTGLDRSRERLWQQHTIPDLSVTALAAHGHTTCGLDDRQALRCWGSSLFTPGGAFRFAMNVEAAASPRPRAEAVDELRGLWTSFGSMVWATGDGQLHHAMWVDSQATWMIAYFRDLNPPAGPILALAGGDVACAIEDAGRGSEALACARAPHDRRAVAGVDQVEALDVSDLRVCLIDDQGAVFCGQHPDLHQAGALEPKPVTGVSQALALASTMTQTCALSQAGRVSCWADPDEVTDIGLEGVQSFAADSDNFCSLDEAGALSCWSPGSSGAEDKPTPTLSTPQVELVAGEDHFCSRDAEGRVSCWGLENHGELGRIPDAISLAPRVIELPEP